ncbi:MAG: hypothetical protein WBW44_03850 [Solirubrobacterales bacterium]
MRNSSRPVLRGILIAFISAIVLTGAAVSTALAGPIVADSGFEVESDGFSFPNYGDREGYKDLDAGQMRRLFGNVVCLSGKGGDCVLTAPARAWMESTNEAMAGGHCYGFSVLAWVIQRGQLPAFGYSSLAPFGSGTTAFGLDIESNRKLQSTIARAWAFQTFESVTDNAIAGTPANVLKNLLTELTPENQETFTITIFQPGFEGGHAITPTSVEDLGGGKYGVHVYDNNWPGDSGRVLTIDKTANTWSYLAAINPDEPGSVYRGNAKTETLQLWPTRPGFQIQDCSFCVGRQGGKSKFNEVSLSNPGDEHAHLLLTDGKGRKTGYLKGKLVNRIPGAEVLPRTAGGPSLDSNGDIDGSPNSLEPIYRVPKKTSLRIKVQGSNLSYNDREAVSVVGPTFDATVEDIKVGPRRNARLTLSPKKRTLSFTSTKVKSTPQVTFGAESDEAAYRITVAALGARPKTKVFFAKKPKLGLLRIGEKTKARQRYAIQISRFTARGNSKFVRRYSIRGKQQAYLYYGPLARKNGVARIAIGEPGKKKIRILKVKKAG